MMYLWHHYKLFDVMTNSWCHNELFVISIFYITRSLLMSGLFFDIMTYCLRHDAPFDVIFVLIWWRTFDAMMNFLTSYGKTLTLTSCQTFWRHDELIRSLWTFDVIVKLYLFLMSIHAFYRHNKNFWCEDELFVIMMYLIDVLMQWRTFCRHDAFRGHEVFLTSWGAFLTS